MGQGEGGRTLERAECEEEMKAFGEGSGKLILGEKNIDLFMGFFFRLF